MSSEFAPTESRCRQTTRAPCSASVRATFAPTKPVAPVTNALRYFQKELFIEPVFGASPVFVFHPSRGRGSRVLAQQPGDGVKRKINARRDARRSHYTPVVDELFVGQDSRARS